MKRFFQNVARGVKRTLRFTPLLIFGPATINLQAAETVDKIINVADTRGMSDGVSKWIAGVYNSSYWEFGLLVIGVMALMGLVLGYCCDRLMGLLGINLGRMRHHE